MLLHDLIAGISKKHEDNVVSDITSDSRKLQAGSLFFVLPRAEKFFDKIFAEAVEKKAALTVHSLKAHKNVGHFVEDVEGCYSKTLQVFYKESFENLKIYGLTGTNGKTSVATMLTNLLELYDVPTGLYGTIGNFFRKEVLETGLTSSTAEDFYRFNHSNYKLGMKAVVCEVSSHALDQKRLGLQFLDGAGFTSFSQDHLDYHKNMDAYFSAKGKILSESLKLNGFFIHPKSLGEASKLKPLSSQKVLCVGGSSCSYQIFKSDFKGIEMEFKHGAKALKGRLPLFGNYNAENFAMALVFLVEHFRNAGLQDFFPDERVFEKFKQISGRMERFKICNHQSEEESFAIVDFSHTPDSLEKALTTLKNLKPNHKLIVVFGCGGDRDAVKRPLMGKLASQMADCVFVTSDNPRTESAQRIADQILEGVVQGSNCKVQLKRRLAIQEALELACTSPSLVLIAGKGHEQTQEIGEEKAFFSDQDEIKKWVIEKRLGERI